MQKSVNVIICVNVAGEDSPAHNFAAEAQIIAQRVVALGCEALASERNEQSLPDRRIIVRSVEAAEGDIDQG